MTEIAQLSEILDSCQKKGQCLIWDNSGPVRGDINIIQRLVYKLQKGEWPQIRIGRTCGEPRCMNVDHFLVGSNSIRKWEEYRKECAKRRALST